MATMAEDSDPEECGMRKRHNVDHGYAWVILASCSILRLLIDGFWTSFGIIFVKWELQFDVTPSETSIIGSTFMLTLLSMAPVSSAITRRIETKVVVVGAGIITVICLFASSFATQFWHLYIIVVILSVAMGFPYQCSFTYFIFFFDKHLALAYMLNGASASIGYLTIPVLMDSLISSYGWEGAFLISSAIMANISVCGLLLPWQHVVKSETSKYAPNLLHDETITDEKKNECWMFFKDITNAFDLTLFTNIPFIFQVIINGTLFGGCFGAPMYLVPYANSVGIPVSQSAFFMVIYGLCMVVIRLLPFGVLVDKNIISASKLSGVIYLIYGTLIMATPLMRTYRQLMLVAALFGILPGLGNPMQYVVVSRSVQRERGPAAMSWFALGNGVGASIVILSVGILYTSTGNYTCSMLLIGSCVLAMGVILLLDPIFHRLGKWLKKDQIAVVEKVTMITASA